MVNIQLGVKPSQTRRWSRLKPTVMVVDKTRQQKTTIFGRNRGIPRTQWVLASTNNKKIYYNFVCA